jgi:hypothetical protein
MILNNDEELLQGAELLKEFFWAFTTHGESMEHQIFRKEIASFFTHKIPSLSSLEERGFKVETIDLMVDVNDDIFFDEGSREFDLSLLPSQEVVYIYIKSKKAGVYFRESRVLVATDWTHSPECIETLKQMVPYLSRIFQKRSPKPPKLHSNITIGADPEFELVCDNGIVSASSVITEGTDSSQLIGKDGAGSQVEIRPKPSSNLSKFIVNFKNALKEFKRKYPEYSLSTQGNIYPLGGHIHLSISPNEEIVELLDNWIGKLVIKLSGLARGYYRKLSAIETKPWGFEYRTPPASIFLRPEVLYAVLKIVKTVLKAYFSHEGVSLEPNPEEISRLKIEKEWKILNDFINEYPKMDKDVLKNWKIKVKVEPQVSLLFRDDWSLEIKYFVFVVLTSKLSRFAKKLNKKGIYKIILFGLRKERGEVCNFESKLFKRIDFNYSINSGKAFGLPYSVRVGELTEELKKKWLAIVDEIISNLLK